MSKSTHASAYTTSVTTTPVAAALNRSPNTRNGPITSKGSSISASSWPRAATPATVRATSELRNGTSSCATGRYAR
jgi:hypothetical protein